MAALLDALEKLTTHAGAMSRSDDAVIASVTRDDLADVGGAFVEGLRQAGSDS
jgi:lipoate synthase